MRREAAVAGLFAVPVALLGGAFAWLASAHGTACLWSVVVHEDGRRTLGDTVLYYRHFLREVPVATLYAAMTAGALWTYGPRRGRLGSGARLTRWAGAAAAALVALAWVAAARQAGVDTAMWDLLQAYVRDPDWAYGSHWGAHLLSSVVYLAAAVVAASLLGRALEGAYPRPRRAAGARWIGGSLVALGVLTLLCKPSWQPFTDPRLVGHQAREVITHVLVSLPLSLAVLLACGGVPTADARPATMPRPPRDVFVAFAVGTVVASFLGASTLAAGAVDVARPGVALSSLVAAHVFEHALDYVLLILLSVWLAGRAPVEL